VLEMVQMMQVVALWLDQFGRDGGKGSMFARV
jgi:hypothetical protein